MRKLDDHQRLRHFAREAPTLFLEANGFNVEAEVSCLAVEDNPASWAM